MRKLLIATAACFVWASAAHAQDFHENRVGPGIPGVNGAINPKSIDNTLYCDRFTSPQACHDALPSTGGKMIMPANTTYVMSSAQLLISKPNVTLECPNWTTVFQRGRAPQSVVSTTGANDVIRDCTIDGNAGSFLTLNVADLQMTGANSLAWHIQAINGGGDIQVALNGGVNSRIAYSTVTGISSDNNIYGIWAIGHVTVMIDHNTISGAGIDGIGFDGEGSIVSNNHLFGNHCYTGINGGQLAQYGTTHNQMIIGNTVDQGCSTQSVGIEVGTGNDVTVSGNAVYNQFSNGITVDPQTNGALISGNTIVNSGQTAALAPYGIAVYGNATHVKISSNRIIDNQGSPTQTYGVYIFGGTSDYIYVTDNDFTGTPNSIVNLTSPGLNVQTSGNFGIGYTGGVAAANDNRVRNPCFAIDQNKEGGTYGQTGGNQFLVDGWVSTTSSSAFSANRSASVPAPGCTTNLHLIQVNQRATPASNDFYNLHQNIMGLDVQDLNWGTSLAKPAMVDFCAKSSVAGTFPFVISLVNVNVWYATTYALAANTLACQSIQIPSQKLSSMPNTNASAIVLYWDMGSGSAQLTSILNTWTSAATTTGVTGETAFVAQTAGATFDLTAVRFYPSQGDVPWAPRTNEQEMAKARQFYQKSFTVGTAVAQNAGATGSIGISSPFAQVTAGSYSFPVSFAPMRAAPSVTFYSPSAASANCYDTTRAADAGAAAATNIGTNSLTATCTLAVGDLLGDLLNVHYTLDARL